jgi:hypothetical protein
MAMAYARLPSGSYPAGVTVFTFPTRWTLKQAWLLSDMAVKDPWGTTVFRASAKILALGWNLNLYDGPTGAPIGQVNNNNNNLFGQFGMHTYVNALKLSGS